MAYQTNVKPMMMGTDSENQHIVIIAAFRTQYSAVKRPLNVVELRNSKRHLP